MNDTPRLAAGPPKLQDIWDGRAEFRSENRNYKAMSVNLIDPRAHSGGGKLSLGVLRDGEIVGVYRRESGPPFTIHMAFSRDGLTFYDTRMIASENGWGTNAGDPAVLVIDIQKREHIFVFYEAAARQSYHDVGVNTAVMWTANRGETWTQQSVPLTESRDLPNWGRQRFRGTSTPAAVIGSDHKHVWVYWTGLYGSNPNHAEIGVGYVGVVRGGTHDWLSLDDGGVLERRDIDGQLQYTIDPPQRRTPAISRGPFDWCRGAVDIGSIVRGDDAFYYSTFVGGHISEGHDDDAFSIGVARSTSMVSFEKYRYPLLAPPGLGRHYGLQYPQLVHIGGAWYLYYVVGSRDFGGSVPNPQECHARLRLQWK